MSAKRRATTDLNHDNWDKDEKEDEEELGSFKMAPEDVLQKRVIRTARRRTRIAGSETKKTPVFSGFSGFNKTQPSSFDFLANLTNGSKASNSWPSKTEDSTQPQTTTELLGNTSSGRIFNSSTSSNITYPTFGRQSTTSVSTFGITSSTATTSVFGMPTSTISTFTLETPISASATPTFGAPSTTAISSNFGTPSSTSVSAVFGSPSTTTISSVFGSPSTTTIPSVFGSLPTSTVSSVFASPSTTTVSSVFGSPTTTIPSVFGSPSTTIVSSVFGSNSTTTVSSVFGSTSTTAVSSVFGSSTTTASSVFGLTSTTTVSSVFGSPTTATSVFKASSSSAVTSIFGTSTSKEVKPVFGSSPSTFATSVFGAPISTARKIDSSVNENPFKIASTLATSSFNIKPPEVVSSKVSSSIFGPIPSSVNNNKSFNTASKSTPFQIKSTTNFTQTTNTPETKVNDKNGSNPILEKVEHKKLVYCSKLRELNESVLEWIIKHVQESPFCLLTPIFKDYEAYLKEIQEEYEDKKDEVVVREENITKNISPLAKSLLNTKNTVMSHTASITTNTPKTIFGTSEQSTTQPPNFSFGFTSTPGTNTTSTGFSFGVSSTQSTTTTTSPFAISNPTSNINGNTPFAFGMEKPFNFNANIKVQSNTEKTSENPEEDDEPPKVDFTPVIEENSVFDTRCKIFVKKDGNFVDKGVGTLYVKKIQDSTKYQLLVRANTNLGNVLLNLILSSSIPTQRMGKNNVMLVCVPTPETKPPPVPVLIRVKTSEEADDLLKTLDKYKV